MPSRVQVVVDIQAQTQGLTSAVRRAMQGATGSVNINTAAAQQGMSKLQSGIQATQAVMRSAQSQAQALNGGLQATVTVTTQAANAFENFAVQAGLAARRFLAFSVAAGGFMEAVRAIKEGTKAAIDFDLAMNKVAQVSGDTSDKVAAIRTEIGRLATGLGASSKQLADSAVTLKQAGLSATEVKQALGALAQSDLAPNFEGMKNTTEGLIAAYKQFNIEAKDWKQTLGSMNAVAGEFAVEANDLVTAVQKAGGAFAAVAGQAKTGKESLAEFMGLFTSVRATTRESADTISTGLRTIFTRLQRSETVDSLRDLGINLRYSAQEAKALGDSGMTNQFVGAYEAVKRLSQGLQGLRETDPRYAQAMEQLGGYRQISRVLPLLRQFDTAQKAVNVALAGEVSLEIAAEKRQEALANKVAKVKEEYLDLFRHMVDSKAFQGMADSLLKVASGFAKVVEFASPLVPILTTLATVKLAQGLGSLAGGFARSFTAPVGSTVAVPRPSTPRRFARGGVVPGHGNADTEPALLMPGEFVVKKSSAQAIGYDRLHAMNEGGGVRHFAGGGQVPFRLKKPQALESYAEDALARYGMSSFELNGYLRAGYEPENLSNTKMMSKAISYHIKRAPRLKKGTVLYRGIDSGELKAIGEQLGVPLTSSEAAGKVYRDLGFTSTSRDKSVAQEYFAGSHLIHILTKDGGMGLDMSRYTGSPSEAETLLQRGGRFKVVSQGDGHTVVQMLAGGGAVNEGPPSRFAAGGSVRALLTPGEFLFNKQAAGRIGLENLHHMNRTGRVPGFASGGLVRMQQGGNPVEQAAQMEDFSKVDTASLLARLNQNAKALKLYSTRMQTIDRVIEKVAGGVDPAGELYDVGSRSLAIASLRHKGEASEFKPTAFIRRAVYSQVSKSAPKTVPLSPQMEVQDRLPVGESIKAAEAAEARLEDMQLHFRQMTGQVSSAITANASGNPNGNQIAAAARAAGIDTAGNSAAENVAALRARAQTGLVTQDQPAMLYQDQVVAAVHARDTYREQQRQVRLGRRYERAMLSAGQAENERRAERALSTPVDPLAARQSPSEAAGVPGVALAYGAPGSAQRQQALERLAQHRHQRGALSAAQAAQGDVFGIASDEVSANKAEGRRLADADMRAYDAEQHRRQSSRDWMDPLLRNRTGRLEDVVFRSGARIAPYRLQDEVDPALLAARATRQVPAPSEEEPRRRKPFRPLYAPEEQQRLARVRADEQVRQGGASRRVGRVEAYGFAEDAERRRDVEAARRDHQLVRRTQTMGRVSATGIANPEDTLALRQALVQGVTSGDMTREEAQRLASGRFSPAQQALFQRQLDFESRRSAGRTSDALAVRDRDGNLVGGSILDRGRAQAQADITARGGANLLSRGTQAQLQQEAVRRELLSSERELLSAQKRLLAQLYPNISAVELDKKAREDVASALAGEARVIRDATGRQLGLQNTVSQLPQGAAAPGAGGFLYQAGNAYQSVKGVFGGFAPGLRRANDFIRNSSLGSAFSSPYATTAAFLALPTITAGLDHGAGSADQAVTAGRETSYSSYKGAAGGLQGALTGALVGASVGGPFAALTGAIGLVAGGIHGVVSSLSDSEKEIRQVKINNALTGFFDKLNTAAASGLGKATPEVIAGLRSNLRIAQAESTEKNRKEATSFFGGFDAQAFSSLQSKSLRQDFGQQLPAFMQSLQRDADSLGRANLGGKVEDLAARLRDGNDGLNREFLGIIANIRGVSLDTVLKELKKNIADAQLSVKRENDILRSREGEERNVNSFVRLLSAVQAASDGLLQLRQQAQVLGDAFSGTVSASHISLRTDSLSQLGRLDSGALRPLDTIASVGGDIGADLRAAGGRVDSAARILPGILASVTEASRGNTKGQDLVTSVTGQLQDRLGNGSADVISSVRARLNDLTKDGPKKLFDEMAIDSSKLSEKLLSAVADPVKEFGSKIGKELESESNKLVDGLNKIAQDMRVVGEGYDQLAHQQVARYRMQMEFQAHDTGREHQALDLMPLASLNAGFNARQQRLAGVQGPQAFAPDFLGQQLERTQEQLVAAQQRRQELAERGPAGPEFKKATEDFLRLSNASANYQQALRALTDTTNRNAAAQEKLGSLRQERDSRLSLAERYATGSVDEVINLNRGALLANKAYNAPGSINQMVNSDRRLLFDFLGAARGTTLTGFKGAPRAEDVRASLLKQLGGGAFDLTGAQKKDEKTLEQTIVANMKASEAAQQQLIKFQEKNIDKQRDVQTKLQEQFFSRLEALLVQEKQTTLENRRGQLAKTQQEQNTRSDQRGLLQRLGINANNLRAVQEKRTDLETLGGHVETLRKQEEVYRNIVGGGALNNLFNQKLSFTPRELEVPWSARNLGFGKLMESNRQKVADFLQNNNLFGGLDPNARGRVVQRFKERVENELPAWSKQTGNTSGEQVRQRFLHYLGASLHEELMGAGSANSPRAQALAGRDELQKRLGGLGINTGTLAEQMAQSGGFQKLKEALEAFPDASKWHQLDKEVAETAQAFQVLKQQLANINKAPQGQNVAPAPAPLAPGRHVLPNGRQVHIGPNGQEFRLASGGSIPGHPGGPRGSDTVPAWLTPGEFVVNRDAAQANMPLLQHINSSRGVAMAAGGKVVAYLAGGGDIGMPWLPGQAAFAANAPIFKMQPGVIRKAKEEGDRRREELKEWTARSQAAQAAVQYEAATNPYSASAALLAQRQSQVIAKRQLDAWWATNKKKHERDQAMLKDPRLPAWRKARIRLRDNIRVEQARMVKARRAEMEDHAGGQGAANVFFAGEAHNFQRRGRFVQRPLRPGEEGQAAIAEGVLGRRQEGAHQAGQRHGAFHRWQIRNGVGNTLTAPPRFATGGMVPGVGSHDSVPAMLTPGEFVMRQSAVQKAGLPALERLNQGGQVGAGYYAAGGSVSGGPSTGSEVAVSDKAVQAMSALSRTLTGFVQQMGGFGQVAQHLSQAFTSFGGHAQALSESIAGMPRELNGAFSHTVTVQHNGAEVLSRLTPEIARMVEANTKQALARVFKEHLPDAGVHLD